MQGNPFEAPTHNGSKYHFIYDSDTLSVGDRIALAQEPILQGLNFFDAEMKTDFWTNFCIQNLEREIEYETTNYWLYMFKSTMNLLLPRYNKLWESTKIEIEKLKSFSHDSERKGEDDSEGHNTGSYSNTGKTVFNDTPTNNLGDADYAENITDASGNGNTQDDGTTNRDYWETIHDDGYNIPQADLILKYRQTLIDVIRMLIDEVSKPIFLKLYT